MTCKRVSAIVSHLKLDERRPVAHQLRDGTEDYVEEVESNPDEDGEPRSVRHEHTDKAEDGSEKLAGDAALRPAQRRVDVPASRTKIIGVFYSNLFVRSCLWLLWRTRRVWSFVHKTFHSPGQELVQTSVKISEK